MSDKRPTIEVHAEVPTPDAVRTFYEVPDAVASQIGVLDHKASFVENLVSLLAGKAYAVEAVNVAAIHHVDKMRDLRDQHNSETRKDCESGCDTHRTCRRDGGQPARDNRPREAGDRHMSDTDLETFPGVEQPDAAPEPALLFMSWRAALANVHGRIEDAYSLRRVWFQHAFDAGFTCAQIGEAAGLSAAAVHKIIGTQRKRDLDSSVVPAGSDGEDR